MPGFAKFKIFTTVHFDALNSLVTRMARAEYVNIFGSWTEVFNFYLTSMLINVFIQEVTNSSDILNCINKINSAN